VKRGDVEAESAAQAEIHTCRTKSYMSAVAKAVGDAYAEPAKDVEGYIAYVKGQKG
jgi:hypothetical protein